MPAAVRASCELEGTKRGPSVEERPAQGRPSSVAIRALARYSGSSMITLSVAASTSARLKGSWV